VLIRDWLLFYAAILAIGVFRLNFLTESVSDPQEQPYIILTRASYSVVGSRIMLNMRGALFAGESSAGESTAGSKTLTNMFPAGQVKSVDSTEASHTIWGSTGPDLEEGGC